MRAVVLAASAEGWIRDRRKFRACPRLRDFIDETGQAQGETLHEHVRFLVDSEAAFGLASATGLRDVEVRATRSLHLMRVWRRACSHVFFCCSKAGARWAAAVWRGCCERSSSAVASCVFAGVETWDAQKGSFLARVPGDQIGDVTVPTDFVGSALLLGRCESA